MKNRSSSYWAKRFIDLHESLLTKSERHTIELEKEYKKAILSLNQDIRSFYVRFSENNKMTLQDARKLLNSKELAEFKWTVEDYIKYGKENAINQQWMKELENASTRIRVRRLESLEMQIRQRLEILAAQRQKGLTSLSNNLVEEGYYKSIYEIQRGFEIGDTFNVLNPRILENIIVKPWAPDGLNFSQRIWRDKTTLINELQTELIQSFIRGDAPDKAIRNISKKMDTSRFAAGRLVMTESAYFASQGQHKAFNELDIVQYEIVATLDTHTSELCRSLDNEVLPMSEYVVGVTAPPFHPFVEPLLYHTLAMMTVKDSPETVAVKDITSRQTLLIMNG